MSIEAVQAPLVKLLVLGVLEQARSAPWCAAGKVSVVEMALGCRDTRLS